ncbi:MarR family transcriptional regulator [Streptacidiphilus carbonis]|uniref:MarR family transcriptional regulator n=1 Tax=Streptacidiphilus carbonis TaxID=105422 RepID=UPI000693C65E|nr:MarR family transcriptional regulator [Streptacidiphilus carbonis]
MTTQIEDAAVAPGDGEDARLRAASAVYATMRYLVLDQDDRRAAVVEALGMSFSRTKALRRLTAGPLRMSELAQKLLTDKPYATLIVDDLERRGLVLRTVHPDDRRCKVVTVTEAGRLAAELAESILARPPRGLLALEDEELETLRRVMAKVEAGS